MSKNGIDYFPFVCQPDDKLELIEAEFGLKGLAIIVKLFQRIYGENGYYCEWSKEVALLFSRKQCGLKLGDNVVSEVVNAAIKRQLFSEEKYVKYGILTSGGIQKRYLLAAKRRTSVEIREEYLLLKVGQIPKNVDIISENVYRNEENVYKNEQSKEEESKGKDIKEEEEETSPSGKGRKPPSFPLDSFEFKASQYLRDDILERIPNPNVPKTDEDLQKWAVHIERMKRLDKLTEDQIRDLIKFATTDSFWQTNILSTGKLREKKDTLYAQMQAAKKEGGRSASSFSNSGKFKDRQFGTVLR